MPHIVIAVTSPITAILLLRGQLRFLQSAGWKVTLLCAPGKELEQFTQQQGVDLISIPMQRQPSPAADLIAIKAIYQALRKVRPDVISYGTPKASLLCSIASRMLGIPARIYVLRGLRAEGLRGPSKLMAILFERITSMLSTEVFCVSNSLMKSAIESNATSPKKTRVIGKGASNGVDTAKFQPSPLLSEVASQLRHDLQIPDDAKVIGFVGRMVKDKGLQELLLAFEEISSQGNYFLLLVGRREENDDLPSVFWDRINNHPRIRWIGEQSDLPGIYQAMDLFVLPSYREGLPNVVLEASAMERPVVVSRVTGARDAVDDGKTGTLLSWETRSSL